jgi:hypothetical protein
MSINSTLQDAFGKHIASGHPQPTAMYLGSREERLLLNEMAKLPQVPEQIAGYPPRPRWCGLPIYRVNEDSHIAFS